MFTRTCRDCETKFESKFNQARFCSSCQETRRAINDRKEAMRQKSWRLRHPDYFKQYEKGREKICPICQNRFRGRTKKFCSNHNHKEKCSFVQEHPEYKSNFQKELDAKFGGGNGHKPDFINALPWQRLSPEKFIKKYYQTMEEL